MNSSAIASLALFASAVCFGLGMCGVKKSFRPRGFNIVLELVLAAATLLFQGFVITTVMAIAISPVLVVNGLTCSLSEGVKWYATAGLAMSTILAYRNRSILH